jgi:2-amino-4-hydroxy-6-hydroxymethyldihydropteridine diphosphokinase
MERVFLGLGSNVGDRRAAIDLATVRLAALPRSRLIARSPIYETPPAGPVEQGPFLNAAAQISTELDPYALLDELSAIEAAAGRSPQQQRVKWGPRVLDLDILLFGSRVISSDELVVPHPMMHERWFVLRPLCDLCPDAVHPILEMTIGDLLRHVESQPAEG